MFQLKESRIQPSEEEYGSLHTSQWRQKDLLLFLLLGWDVEKVSRVRLQEIWGFFLHALRKKQVETKGFHKDAVTGQYGALDSAIIFLFQLGLAESRSSSPGYLFFCGNPRDREIQREGAPQTLLEAIDEVGPIVLRLYKEEITSRKGLSLLRLLREKNRELIPA